MGQNKLGNPHAACFVRLISNRFTTDNVTSRSHWKNSDLDLHIDENRDEDNPDT
jgi:hypothetical protein